MAASLDFFFEFGSTYSYLAAMRIRAVARDARVTVRSRPFLLGPIFKAQGSNTSPFNRNSDKGRYMWRDLARLSADLGLPFRRPDPFPQSGLLAARVALVGLTDSWGETFCESVFAAEFGEGRQIAEPAVLADILRGLDVAPEPVLARAQSDEIKTKLRAETDVAQRLGVFGAPTFITADGELFWGNDRLEQALAWANKRVGDVRA
jgi:2-hydroxychromene-2-carboxylate isomerase